MCDEILMTPRFLWDYLWLRDPATRSLNLDSDVGRGRRRLIAFKDFLRPTVLLNSLFLRLLISHCTCMHIYIIRKRAQRSHYNCLVSPLVGSVGRCIRSLRYTWHIRAINSFEILNEDISVNESIGSFPYAAESTNRPSVQTHN